MADADTHNANSSDHEPPERFDGLCTVTMQGGGVFGISLLGQLQAIEEAQEEGWLRPMVYAGASAGGLLAALRWAGFAPTKIREKLKELTRRGRLAELFGPSKDQPRAWSANSGLVKFWTGIVLSLWTMNAYVRWGILALIIIALVLVSICCPYGHWIIGALVMLVILLAAWTWRTFATARQNGGLYALGGFTDQLDEWFRECLEEDLAHAFGLPKSGESERNADEDDQVAFLGRLLNEISLPLPRSDRFDTIRAIFKHQQIELAPGNFDDHRPRFLDFDVARHSIDDHPAYPALILSVTNLATQSSLFIDSYRGAFEQIPVADAVRATIAFPGFFQPAELRIPRDSRRRHDNAFIDDLVTADSLAQTKAAAKIQAGAERCVDGGVLANFPLWALDDYLRQTLYGHSMDLVPERVRFKTDNGEGERIREQLVPQPKSNKVEIRTISDGESYAPLRLFGYRPLVHIGLSLKPVSPNPVAPMAGQILNIIFMGARTFWERRAIRSGCRTLLIEQDPNDAGWPHHFLAFGKLNKCHIDHMFNRGHTCARQQLEDRKAGWDLPKIDKGVRIARTGSETSIADVLTRAARQASIFAQATIAEAGLADPPNIVADASFRLLHGTRLRWIANQCSDPSFAVPRASDHDDISKAHGQGHWARSYVTRRALLVRRAHEGQTDDDDPHNTAVARIILPIVDRSEIKRGEFGARLTSLSSVDEMPLIFTFSETREVVVFGTLVIDIHLLRHCCYEAADDVWKAIYHKVLASLPSSLHALSADAETLSALLTQSYCPTNALTSGRPDPTPHPDADPSTVVFRKAERITLRKFWNR